MSIFITNLMFYINHKKYKHSFIAQLSNIDLTRFNTIISKEDSITLDEMERISDALGIELYSFFNPNFKDQISKRHSSQNYNLEHEKYNHEIKELSEKLLQLAQNFDAVVGAKDRMMRHFQRMAEQELKELKKWNRAILSLSTFVANILLCRLRN